MRGRRVVDILSGSGPDNLGSNPSDSVKTFFRKESFIKETFSLMEFYYESNGAKVKDKRRNKCTLF